MAKKDKKPKLPKEIGGVKLPKDLRKTAKSALKLAQNPIAREVISAALVAGAAALAKHKGGQSAPEPKSKGTDIGALLAQGVAAFVGGLTRPAEKDIREEPAPAAGNRQTGAKRPPLSSE